MLRNKVTALALVLQKPRAFGSNGTYPWVRF